MRWRVPGGRAAARDPIEAWIASLLPPLAARAKGPLVRRTVRVVRAVRSDLPTDEAWRPDQADTLWLIEAMADAAFDLRHRLVERERLFDEFSARYFRAEGEGARRLVAEDHLRATVSDPRRLRGDLRALRRHLDHEALSERHQRHLHDLGQRLELCLQVIQRAAERLEDEGFVPPGGGGADGGSEALARYLVEFMGLVPFLLELARHGGRWKTRVAAFKTLCFLMERALASRRPLGISPAALREVVVAGQDPGENLHIQRDATRLMLLVDPEEGMAIVERRLLRSELPGPRDDMLYRAHAVRLVAELFPTDRAIDVLGRLLERDDPSEHVRMTLARTLGHYDHPDTDALLRSMGPDGSAADPSHRVRAAASEAWGEILARAVGALARDPEDARWGDRADRALEALAGAVRRDGHAVAQRVAVEELADGVRRLLDLDPRGVVAELLRDQVAEMLAVLAAAARGESVAPAVAFVAARLLAEIAPRLDPSGRARIEELEGRLGSLRPGQRVTLSLAPEDAAADPAVWGELLATLGQGDRGFSARPGRGRLTVQRGDRERWSLWRALHEALSPAPDKRQGRRHTTAPRRLGPLRAPPAGMAAVTPTTVPGEPVMSPRLGSWGPHLPGVQDLLDAAVAGREIALFHPHGRTVVRPPAGAWRRAVVAWRLRLGFGALDALRQRSVAAEDAEERQRFVAAARALGFDLRLEPRVVQYQGHAYDLRNPLLEQFWPPPPRELLGLLPALPTLTTVLDRSWNYLVSPGGNSLAHLTAFLGAMGIVVMGDAVVQAARIRRLRRSIPLVIGGWGTRGKSGTERLKAALFHALGYEVLSKTTGCEAMVIHSAPGIEPREIFLYRPYDKASIWEQRDVLALASRMGAQVMLWECMALQPRYVEILAQEWMKDDLATVTNCYPDHEDVQGPSGADVAQTISRFVPRGSVVLTTEQEMAPVIAERAREQGTRCVVIGDRAAEMIPRDLLDRFPYREHPRNVALVARLAEELGIDAEFAIVAMADHVVPDVGSLKVFPPARYRGRTLTYINGHSANERTGFLNNYQRTGLADFDPDAEPGVWIGAVVNNRADRVPRSRVFASIVAGDVAAHVIVLIGTNLSGFEGYLRHALGQLTDSFRLGPDRAVAESRLRRLLARLHLRRCDGAALNERVGAWLRGNRMEDADVERRLADSGFRAAAGRFVSAYPWPPGADDLRRVLDAVEGDADLSRSIDALCVGVRGDARDRELSAAVRREVALTGVAAAALRAVRDGGSGDALDERLRRLFTNLVMERVRPLRDASATGDQVLDFVTSQIPPGVHARVMGMQNIKGTGLDFVYRWVGFEQVTAVIEELQTSPRRRTRELLRWLRSHPDYGLLDARLAARAVQRLRATRFVDWDDIDREAEALQYVLRDLARSREQALTRSTARRGVVPALLGVVERGLDYLHSVHRRRAADRIFDDLVERRISHARAATLMRELTVVQKGGWLRGAGGH